MDFNHENENDVDFTKTFDLTGNDNDQMLKFYLKKAGLSDNIEYLSSEQRRAFIYDIVKSNKNPGYWKPSVLPQTPTSSRAPIQKTQVQRDSTITLDSIDDIPPASTTFDWAKYRQVNNNANSNGEHNNLHVEQKSNPRSTLYERQFSQKNSVPKTLVINASPASTSLPTTTLRTRKGRIIEVSGPQNFRHISGDTSRGMTKNTFDLTGNFNNNSLKKYMIERGITDTDVSGLDCKELIRRIVQSNYTWTPPRRQHMKNTIIPPPPSETYVAAQPTPPSSSRNVNVSKGGAIIVAPPALPDVDPEPSNENIYEEVVQPIRNTTSIRRNRRKPLPPPPPPPVQSNIATASVMTPQQLTNRDDSSLKLLKNKSPPSPKPIKQTAKTENCSPPPPPPPPPMPIKETLVTQIIPPPPPPNSAAKPTEKTFGIENCMPPPPPPMPPKVSQELRPLQTPTLNKSQPTQTEEEPNRDAFLQSIRNGIALKKVTSQEKLLKKNLGTSSVSKQSQQQLEAAPLKIRDQLPMQPEKPDFMSELRNATLKRIKKLEHNPYASESEC